MFFDGDDYVFGVLSKWSMFLLEGMELIFAQLLHVCMIGHLLEILECHLILSRRPLRILTLCGSSQYFGILNA